MFDGLTGLCSIVYSDNMANIVGNILCQLHSDAHGYIITSSELFDYYTTKYPYASVTTYTDSAELNKYAKDIDTKYILFDYGSSYMTGYNNIIKSLVNIEDKTCIIAQHKLYSYNKSVVDNIDNFIIDSVNVNYGRIYNSFMDLKHRYAFDEFVKLCDKNLVIINWSSINVINGDIEVSKSDHNIIYMSMMIDNLDTTTEPVVDVVSEAKIEENTSRCMIL